MMKMNTHNDWFSSNFCFVFFFSLSLLFGWIVVVDMYLSHILYAINFIKMIATHFHYTHTHESQKQNNQSSNNNKNSNSSNNNIKLLRFLNPHINKGTISFFIWNEWMNEWKRIKLKKNKSYRLCTNHLKSSLVQYSMIIILWKRDKWWPFPTGGERNELSK